MLKMLCVSLHTNRMSARRGCSGGSEAESSQRAPLRHNLPGELRRDTAWQRASKGKGIAAACAVEKEREGQAQTLQRDALAPRPRIRSKKERRVPYARSARQQRHVYFLILPFLLRTLFGAGRRAALKLVLVRSLSFSTAHAAAIPLPVDALPRRVTPKLAG